MSQSLLLRVIIVFIAVLVLSNSVTFTFMNGVFRSNTFSEVLRGQIYSMQKVKKGFENWTDHLEKSTLDIIYDSHVQQSLIDMADGVGISRRLTQLAYKEGLLILYADNKQNIYTSNNVFRPGADAAYYMQSDLYNSFCQSYASLVWRGEGSSFLPVKLKTNELILLTAGRQVRHLELDVEPGFLLIQCAPGKLALHIEDSFMKEGTRYLLLTRDGRVLYDTQQVYMAGDIFPDAVLLGKAQGNVEYYFGHSKFGKQLYVFDRTEETDLILLSCLPEDSIYEETFLTRKLLSVLLLSMLSITVIVLTGISGFVKPLNQIIQAHRQVRNGEYGVQVDVRRADEIGELALSFNKMSRDLKVQVAQIHENEQQLKNAEMDALMYQVTPHFLYNTLDNINMLAKCSDEKRISMLITELSALLRGSLSVKTETVPVKNELAYTEHYLKIMQIRYPNLFTYSIDCPSSLKNVQILKLILQPLVENCIHHAFEFMDEGGIIRVSVWKEEEWLYICVEDNGPRLSEIKKNQMNYTIRNGSVERNGGTNVGLANVFRRGTIYYGEDTFDLFLSGSRLGGLCVRVAIRRAN
jgi:two-component system sensor histidine kinase YesM